MKDQFFDMCVQLTILSHFVDEEDEKTCLGLVKTLLHDQDFQTWTRSIDPEEVDHIATIFVNRYEEGIISEIIHTLPLAMQNLLDKIDQLELDNCIQRKELQYLACKDLYESMDMHFKAMLEAQRDEIHDLKWKNMSKFNST